MLVRAILLKRGSDGKCAHTFWQESAAFDAMRVMSKMVMLMVLLMMLTLTKVRCARPHIHTCFAVATKAFT